MGARSLMAGALAGLLLACGSEAGVVQSLSDPFATTSVMTTPSPTSSWPSRPPVGAFSDPERVPDGWRALGSTKYGLSFTMPRDWVSRDNDGKAIGPRGNIGRVCHERNRYRFRWLCEVQAPDTGYESHFDLAITKMAAGQNAETQSLRERGDDSEQLSPRKTVNAAGRTWWVTERSWPGSPYGACANTHNNRVPCISLTYYTDLAPRLLLTLQLQSSGRPEYEQMRPTFERVVELVRLGVPKPPPWGRRR